VFVHILLCILYSECPVAYLGFLKFGLLSTFPSPTPSLLPCLARYPPYISFLSLPLPWCSGELQKRESGRYPAKFFAVKYATVTA